VLLAHANTLTRARSRIAALADHAATAEASAAYEHVLIELDWRHGDDLPALDALETVVTTVDRDVVWADAVSAVEQLVAYGLDELHIELLIAELAAARALDAP
jgi:hypothetical protein